MVKHSMIPSKRCSFSVEQSINAPLHLVWSLVRNFHNPKAYKFFIRSCSTVQHGHINTPGSAVYRKITHVTGYPAKTSIERLDRLDDDTHVMVFSIVGGDESDRLANYQSTVSLHEVITGSGGTTKRTVVTEKYTVDVPQDSNEEDTRVLVDTLVGLNLKSLARVAERMVETYTPSIQ